VYEKTENVYEKTENVYEKTEQDLPDEKAFFEPFFSGIGATDILCGKIALPSV
jgi:hypothetical protein